MSIYLNSRVIGGDEIPRAGLKLWLDVAKYDSYIGHGTAWRDMSGHNNDVTLVNANSTGNGSIDFDGTGDYAWLANLNYGGDPETGDNVISNMTVLSWFKTSESGGSYSSNWSILDFDRSEAFSFYIREDTGKIGFSGDDGNSMEDLYSDTACNDGEWHMAAVTFDQSAATEVVFYLDGEEDGSDSSFVDPLGTGQATRYGCIGDGSEMTSENGTRNDYYFIGEIAVLLFYEGSGATLTASEIKQIYNVYRGRFGV